jgi:hypothetical protein
MWRANIKEIGSSCQVVVTGCPLVATDIIYIYDVNVALKTDTR